MKRNLLLPFLSVCTLILICSCVKDTDFDQADEIALTPVVELDLIYFNLDASDFFDSISQTPRLEVTDTTEIRFLDDTFVQEDLKSAEFLFNFTNSIPRNFQVDFRFLNETNDTTYTAGTTVAEGSLANPVVTSYTETVIDEDVISLTQADRVVVVVTIPSADASLEGALNLQSKTTYFLEIKD